MKSLGPVSQTCFRGLAAFWQAGVDFVYPPHCLLCRAELSADANETGSPALCSACQQNLAPEIPDSCRRCGAPVGPYLNTSAGCMVCRKTTFHFDGLVRLGVYKDHLQRACLRIKNPVAEPLTTALADLLWSRHAEALRQARPDVVLSVPHHWTQRLTRPHNPAETLARRWANRLDVPLDGLQLVKTRRTPAQKSLPPSRRLTNLRNAFRLRCPRLVSGRRILLVDDVLTTGTTANRLSRLLKQAGAGPITVAVLALGLGDAR